LGQVDLDRRGGFGMDSMWQSGLAEVEFHHGRWKWDVVEFIRWSQGQPYWQSGILQPPIPVEEREFRPLNSE